MFFFNIFRRKYKFMTRKKRKYTCKIFCITQINDKNQLKVQSRDIKLLVFLLNASIYRCIIIITSLTHHSSLI